MRKVNRQTAWELYNNRIQGCFLAACMDRGIEAILCPIPKDISRDTLIYADSDTAAEDFVSYHLDRQALSMQDYIAYCDDYVNYHEIS